MKHRIVTDSHAHEFRLLRNRIEGELKAPAVILVTSASERDGAHLTAFGLAESLNKTHQRTALVMTSSPVIETLDAQSPGQPTLRRRASDRVESGHATGVSGVSTITISRERLATISRSNVASLVDGLRAEHDYVVIDAGDLANNSFGLMLATSADATLVTFLVGREELPSDRAMLDTLERAEAKVFGVVMNSQEAIDSFVRREYEHEHEIEPVVQKKAGVLTRLETAWQKIGKSF